MSENWQDEVAGRIADEIKRLRGGRSGQWLSDRTAELGYRVSRSTISEIETKKRKSISITDLIVLAEALSVSPLSLLYGSDDGSVIEYVPGEQVQRLVAVQRFSGINEAALARYEETIAAMEESTQASLESAKMAEAAARLMQKVVRESRRASGPEAPEERPKTPVKADALWKIAEDRAKRTRSIASDHK